MGVRGWLRTVQCVLPIVALVACGPEEAPELGNQCGLRVEVNRQGIVSHQGCGGCDGRCWISTDDPDDAVDVDHDPSSPDYNADMTVFDLGDDGIVLGGAVMGPDADGDGLGDAVDPTPGDANGDADGDGIPDAWEVFSGTDPTVANLPPPGDEFYVVLPEGGAPVSKTIPPSVPLTLRSADIYFLVDTTGSMGDEIINLRDSLSTYVIPEVQKLIADVQFGVGEYRDYADSSGTGIVPYRHLENITTNTAAVQAAITGLGANSTPADLAESAAAALYSTISGNGLGCGVGDAPPCLGVGNWGYPCFRNDAQPIIVLVTDHEFHNGVWDTEGLANPVPGSCYEYSSGGCDGASACLNIPATDPDPSLEDVITNYLVPNDVKIVGVWTGWPGITGRFSEAAWGITYPDYDDVIDIWYLVNGTGSTDSLGVPFLFGAGYLGGGIGVEVVSGIDALVSELLLDATATWLDPDPTGPDTSVLVNDVDPIWCGDCTSLDALSNTAFGVKPGSGVTFEVTLENAMGDIPIQFDPQVYDVLIEIRSDKGVLLGERTVHVLVPGTSGLITDPVVGTYWNVYDPYDTCEIWETVLWQRFFVDMTTPAGTDITFTARTAANEGDLATALEVPFVPDARSEADLEAVLLGAVPPQSTNLDFLQITATLTAAIPGDSPVLHSMTVEHYCL